MCKLLCNIFLQTDFHTKDKNHHSNKLFKAIRLQAYWYKSGTLKTQQKNCHTVQSYRIEKTFQMQSYSPYTHHSISRKTQ